MKSGQLFWGFFLLALGALFLLTKYDVVQSSFDFVYNVWPMIFVFWGALVIFKNSLVRPVISALFGIFLALLLFGLIENALNSFDFSEHDGKYTEYYNEDYDKSIEYASLEINSGAGSFLIKGTTDKLAEGRSKGSFAEYDFETWKDENQATVRFDLHKRNFNFFRGRLKNYLEVSLNPNPVWDIHFNGGASKSNFDLTEFKTRRVSIHTGASSAVIKLGDKYDSTDVDIEMGVASLTLEIPSNSGCSIDGDMALVSRDFTGFTKRESGHYETENFNNAVKKVFIRIDGGVSSIKVVRY
ncbi:MAG: DUF5668 domain-containing protein [Bacteroidota bacterium]